MEALASVQNAATQVSRPALALSKVNADELQVSTFTTLAQHTSIKQDVHHGLILMPSSCACASALCERSATTAVVLAVSSLS